MPLPIYLLGHANRHAPDRPEMEELYRLRNKLANPSTRLQLETPYEQAHQLAVKKFFDTFGLPGVSLIGIPGFSLDTPLDVARGIIGVEATDEMTRIGETNTFVRCLTAISPESPEYQFHLRLSELLRAKELASIPLGVTLPGPYTLAKYTRLPGAEIHSQSFWALARRYAEIINQEIRELQRAGAALVRIDETELPHWWQDIERHLELLQTLTAQTDFNRLALSLGTAALQGSFTAGKFFDLPFSAFFLDFVQNGHHLGLLHEFPKGKTLVVGIMDGEDSHLESEAELQALTLAIRAHISTDRLALALNADLWNLPWNAALQKLRRLTEFAAKVDVSVPRPMDTSERFYPRPTLENRPLTEHSIVRVGLDDVAASRAKHTPNIAFPVISVGSFPQTLALRRARKLFRDGKLSFDDCKNAALEETRRALEHQERLDFTVAMSGEFFRPDMAEWSGCHMGGTVDYADRLPSFDNFRYAPVSYAKLISFEPTGFLRDELKLIQPLTKLPMCVTITGPETHVAWGFREHPGYYHNPFGLRMALAERLANEIECLINAGVSIIQIDEPALTARKKDFASSLVALERLVAPFVDKAYFVLHVCYSDSRTLREYWPHILKLPFHKVHMEYANRGDEFLPLAQMIAESGKDIGLGVLDVHNDRIETAGEIVARAEKVFAFFGQDNHRLTLSPDCGQKAQNWDITEKKNEQMVIAAKMLRERYPGQ